MKKITTTVTILSILLVFVINSVQSQTIKPTKVIRNVHYDVSSTLIEMHSFEKQKPITATEIHKPYKPKQSSPNDYSRYKAVDPVVQNTNMISAATQGAEVVLQVPGIGRRETHYYYYPPDTQGDVGPNHYVQIVNSNFVIFDKSGSKLTSIKTNKSVWQGFDDGQPFDYENGVDPIVLYDEYADRWLMGVLIVPENNDSEGYILVAVSTSPDPTGSYYRYAFAYDEVFADYEKFGVWNDGYYMTANEIFIDGGYNGASLSVFDREAMINGDSNASVIYFNLGTSHHSLLPADADGPLAPPVGAPHVSMALSSRYSNTIERYLTTADWGNIGNSSIEIDTIHVAQYNNGRSASQPGTSTSLWSLGSRFMYRLQYRNFGSHQSLVTNHTVYNSTTTFNGIRWYELRDVGEGFHIHQQGTYNPADGIHRWMGSVAMNGKGDIALGYSVSNATNVYPSISFTGQTAGAPMGLGVMDIEEKSILEGGMSQTGSFRWGDYSMMSVDPTDDYSFWYTQEYSDGSLNWLTRVAKLDLHTPCASPMEMRAIDINATNAKLVWSANQSEGNWEILIDTIGFDTAHSTPIAVNSNFYLLEGLTANEAYEWYIRSLCPNGEYGNWVGPETFNTNCETILPIVLPFIQDWELDEGTVQFNSTFLCASDQKWNFETENEGKGRLSYGSDAYLSHSGSGALTLDKTGNGVNTTNFVILNIDLSNYQSSEDLRVSFWYTDHGDENSIHDKVWARGDNTSDWVELFDIVPSDITNNTYYFADIDLDSALTSVVPVQAIGSDFQLRFGQEDNYSVPTDGISYDDLMIYNGCKPPSELNLSSVTDTSAVFSWVEKGDALSWEILIGEKDFDTTLAQPFSSDHNPHKLLGLLANTDYDIYLRSVCSEGGNSPWVGPIVLNTNCDNTFPIVLPYFQDWEIPGGEVKKNQRFYCESEVKWSFETQLEGEGRVSFGTKAHMPFMGEGGLTLDRPNDGSSRSNYAILTTDLSNYQANEKLLLSFWYTDHGNSSTINSKVWVRGSASNDWLEAFDFNPAVKTDNVYHYVELDIDSLISNASFPQIIGEDFQVRFGQNGNGPTPNDGISIDNIRLFEGCKRPQTLSVSKVTNQGAKLKWTEVDDAVSWEIILDTIGFDTSNNSPTIVYADSYLWNGLDDHTGYEWYVRSVCGTDKNSQWSGPFTFFTECSDLLPVTLPYFQGWETEGETRHQIGPIACSDIGNWYFFTQSHGNGRVSYGTDAYLAHRGTGALTLDCSSYSELTLNYAILTLDLSQYDQSTSLMLSFCYADHSDQSHHGKDNVWIRGSKELPWLSVYDLDPGSTQDNIYQLVELDIDSILLNASPPQLIGSTFQVRFGQKGSVAAPIDGISFDNISVHEGCRAPYNLASTNITDSSVNLSWVEKETATNWELVIDTTGFDYHAKVPIILNSADIIIDTLLPSASYDWYVRSICSDVGKSAWVGPISFKTDCDIVSPIVLPYIQDWEIPGEILLNDGGIVCGNDANWHFETDHQGQGRASIGTEAYLTHSGEGALTFDRISGGNVRNYAILTADLTSYIQSSLLKMSFWYTDHGDESYSSYPYDKVWLRGSDSDSWIEVYDLMATSRQNNVYHYVEIDLDSALQTVTPAQVLSSTFQVRFGQVDNGHVPTDGISFDDIVIFEDCPVPSELDVASNLGTSVDLNWSTSGAITEWEIILDTSGFDTTLFSPINVTVLPYNYSGLNPSTNYEFYVRSLCSNGFYGEWAGPHSFTTGTEAVILPYLEDWEMAGDVKMSNNMLFSDNYARWDFATQHEGEGRISYGNHAHMSNSGDGAFTMDRNSSGPNSFNYAILTLNMEAYKTSNWLTLSFWYNDHSDEYHPMDRIWIRGSKEDDWIQIYNLRPYLYEDNVFRYVESDIDYTLANADPPQQLSSTFQVRFGQHDNQSVPFDGITFDDISIHENCWLPENLKTTHVTTTTATLNWDMYLSSDEYDVIVGPAGFDISLATPTSVNEQFYEVSGLQKNTNYEWYVRSKCQGGRNSDWVGPASFYTYGCDDMTVFFYNSEGNYMPGGELFYREGGGDPWVATYEIQDGVFCIDTDDNSIQLRMIYDNQVQTKHYVSTSDDYVLETKRYIVELRKPDGTLGYNGAEVSYTSNGWNDFGVTGDDVEGIVQKEMLPIGYTFKLKYKNGLQEQTINPYPSSSTITFNCVKVLAQLNKADGARGHNNASVSYKQTQAWQNIGETGKHGNGQVRYNLLPGVYKFKMEYKGGTQTINDIDISEPQNTVLFQTAEVTVKLLDSNDEGVEGGVASNAVNSWNYFGITDSGGARTSELLPDTYVFKMEKDGLEDTKSGIAVPTEEDVLFYLDDLKSTESDLGTDIGLACVPNPFNHETTLAFSLADDRQVSITIYDMNGQIVEILKKGQLSKGKHKISWDGKNKNGHTANNGIYIVRLVSGDQISHVRLVKM